MKSVSRRDFFKNLAIGVGVSMGAVLVLANCEKKTEQNTPGPSGDAGDPCGDLSGVAESDIELRKKFAYVSESPIADNQCNNCNLYLPPKSERACGGCMLFKGPVYPSAYCTYWAPKV